MVLSIARCSDCVSLISSSPITAICPTMIEFTNQKESRLPDVPVKRHAWKSAVAQFQKPDAGRAIWQVINSVGTYVFTWLLIYLTIGISFWLTLGLALLGAGLVVRIFIISHDCGHGSFFASKRANTIVGFITGVLSYTPFQHWRWAHARHHATSGDLDKRGIGDVWTMTVREYLQASRWRRFCYRLARNPLVLLVAGPLYLVLISNRFSTSGSGKIERRSIYGTNLCILLVAATLVWLFGFQTYLWIQTAIILASGMAGVWLFYVQHQFEGAYWQRGDEWSYVSAALEGSSFYRLPRVLQWFSGNIGYHHIHHLSSRIPNYNLEECHYSDPLFQQVKEVTLRDSLRCFGYHLWDEETEKLISFKQLSNRELSSGS